MIFWRNSKVIKFARANILFYNHESYFPVHQVRKKIPHFYILIIHVFIKHFLFSPFFTLPLIFVVITLLLPPYLFTSFVQYYSILNTCFIPIIINPLLPLTHESFIPPLFNQNSPFNLVLIHKNCTPPQCLIKLTPHNILLLI